MKRSLLVEDPLRDLLRHLPPLLKRKVYQAIQDVVADPAIGKPLVEGLVGLRSLRLGKLRLVYRADNEAVTLIAFGPRPTIYHQAALELARQRHP